ncbi:hypothetical protein Pan216_45840 [Planctomycetes bacterium Pan216]|uniref:Uncharacterized protein n=1 Tax=Kolteria novifilia TaxID=2527975 RepID=A0A518B9W3_9BACT|nr:hypothetical protein Pan216_45840 [Planctomycetes bacterium Pan216]
MSEGEEELPEELPSESEYVRRAKEEESRKEEERKKAAAEVIDWAIRYCETCIQHNRTRYLVMMTITMIVLLVAIAGLMALGYLSCVYGDTTVKGVVDQKSSEPAFGFKAEYWVGLGFVSFFVFAISILMSLCRSCLNEISKYEYFAIGFMRIKITAEAYNQLFQEEARDALTGGAFIVPQKTGLFSRGKVESPLPGHPASDVVTSILNKILDKVSVDVRG